MENDHKMRYSRECHRRLRGPTTLNQLHSHALLQQQRRRIGGGGGREEVVAKSVILQVGERAGRQGQVTEGGKEDVHQVWHLAQDGCGREQMPAHARPTPCGLGALPRRCAAPRSSDSGLADHCK